MSAPADSDPLSLSGTNTDVHRLFKYFSHSQDFACHVFMAEHFLDFVFLVLTLFFLITLWIQSSVSLIFCLLIAWPLHVHWIYSLHADLDLSAIAVSLKRLNLTLFPTDTGQELYLMRQNKKWWSWDRCWCQIGWFVFETANLLMFSCATFFTHSGAENKKHLEGASSKYAIWLRKKKTFKIKGMLW